MTEHQEPSPEEILRTIERALRKRGVRWTKPREAIVRAVIQSDRHLTAEEILAEARQIDSSVSTATVYRTISLLVDSGMAARRSFQGASASFELVIGKGHHHHLIDVESGRIIEFTHEQMDDLLTRFAREQGYRIACHKIEVFGVPLGDEASVSRRRKAR